MSLVSQLQGRIQVSYLTSPPLAVRYHQHAPLTPLPLREKRHSMKQVVQRRSNTLLVTHAQQKRWLTGICTL
ncbi:hypothetical protein BC567DRAFT_216692 [Phyllosticta citribraziliensis]